MEQGGGLDLAALRPILADLGLSPPVAATELPGGSNRAIRLDLASGETVVLKTYDEVRRKMPVREAQMARLLADLDLPVTRYVAMDETCRRLPFRFAITNYLPGVGVGTLRDEPDVQDAYRQMGALLRQLHTVRLPAYGQFDETGVAVGVASNEAFVTNVAQHAFAQFRRHGGDAGLAVRLERIVADGMDLARHSAGPVFAHDDMHPGNVLALREGNGRLRLSGVIDFGNARAADAIFDLAKMLFCSEHEAPGCTAAMLAGYGPVDHPDPTAALWFYSLIHRVVMWWWLRHVGFIAEGDGSQLIDDLRQMAEEGPPGRGNIRLD